MNRKNFIQQIAIGTGSMIAIPYLLSGQNTPVIKSPKADPLPPEKVKDFVTAGHNNLDNVKSLLLEFPTLLYATWDWGGGDFETAIE